MAISNFWMLLVPLGTSLGAEALEGCHQEHLEENPADSLSMLQLLRGESLDRAFKAGASYMSHSHSSNATYFWAGKNGDLSRTGASPFPVPTSMLERSPNFSFQESHGKVPQAGVVRATALIDGDKHIYLASTPGRIYKFKPAGSSLHREWAHHEGSVIPGVPSLMDGKLFSATVAGDVFALDIFDGKVVWRTSLAQTGQPCASISSDTWSMTAVEGVVIAPCATTGSTSNNLLVALNATSGAQMWTFCPDQNVYNLLIACSNGSAVFSDLTGTAYRLRISDGQQLWRTDSKYPESFSTGGTVIGPNGVVYVTSNTRTGIMQDSTQGILTALDFGTGQQIWQTTLKHAANNGAAVGMVTGSSNLTVVLGVGANPDSAELVVMFPPGNKKDNSVVAVDAETGKLRWSFELPVRYGAARGDTLAHNCLPDAFGNAAISGDGTVYFGNQNGKFYGIGDNNGDGTIDESSGGAINYDAQNAFQGSPGIAPGMLVATPCNGMLVWLT